MTIPKALRVRLGIKPGQVLEVEEEGGRLVITKSIAGDPVDDVYGIVTLGGSTDQLLRKLRWDEGEE